jgi:hypothetical protein
MANYTIALKDLPAYLRARPKQVHAAMTKAMRLSAKTDALVIIQNEISNTQPAPVDRGTYRRGWQARDLDNGVAIFNPTPYAAVIEHGRRKGARQPPIAPLQAWVLRKGLTKGIRGKQNREKAAKGIAFAIARKMVLKGKPGMHILEHAVARWKPVLLAAIKDAVLNSGAPNANKP